MDLEIAVFSLSSESKKMRKAKKTWARPTEFIECGKMIVAGENVYELNEIKKTRWKYLAIYLVLMPISEKSIHIRSPKAIHQFLRMEKIKWLE